MGLPFEPRRNIVNPDVLDRNYHRPLSAAINGTSHRLYKQVFGTFDARCYPS